MKFIETPLRGLYVINSKVIEDERGFFFRSYCKEKFAEIQFQQDFVQFNHSFNKKKGTLRGMHFQKMPHSESKLIRCVQGSVYDVAVDLRKDSPTFLQYFGVTLSAKNRSSILIPMGFAHGFQTLEENSALIYHHTEYYTPGSDSGLRYDDERLKINWPLPIVNLSQKDKLYTLIDNNFEGILL